MIKLNKEQKDYVECEENSLVVACPGSGKTRAICSKVIALLEKNPRKKIAVITYTNRAADEIHERIHQSLTDTKNIWIGTIHAFCLQWVLRAFRSEIIELRHGFTLADDFVVGEILSSLKSKYGYNYYEDINTKYKVDGSLLEQDTKKQSLVREYHLELKNRKMIDYDQVLLICYRFLNDKMIAAKLLGNVFDWIIIDEYQDTQPLQYMIICALSTAAPKLKVSFVGDPDQAIYTTLGGVAYTHTMIEKAFLKKFRLHKFDGCYRSSQKIIDFYSKFKEDTLSIRSMITEKTDPFVFINKQIHRDDLAKELSRIILLENARGVPDNEICVIAPQWDMVNEVVKKLKSFLPNKKIDSPGASPIYKNKDNFWYPLSKIFLNESTPGLLNRKRRWARECIALLDSLGVSLNESLSDLQFLELVNKSKSKSLGGVSYLEECFDNLTKFLDIKMELFPLIASQKDEFIKGTRDRITKWAIPDSVDVFKSYFHEKEGLVVNTLHGVKGEEYQVVIAFGFVMGKVPNWNIVYSKIFNPEEESRKLFYVTCSRAKERLYIFCEQGHQTRNGAVCGPTPIIPDSA